jgi:hypothetical protein
LENVCGGVGVWKTNAQVKANVNIETQKEIVCVGGQFKMQKTVFVLFDLSI